MILTNPHIQMNSKVEYVKGIPHHLNLYSPRFTSTLPILDQSLTGGAELLAELDRNDGFDGNGSLIVQSHLGGQVKCQELLLWKCNDIMITEPIVIETVVKRSSNHKSQWSWVLRGNVETVEPLKEQKSEWIRRLVFGEQKLDHSQEDFLKIRPCFHTNCGQDWERFYWIVYPVVHDYHITCITSISLACECERFEEDTVRLGLFYLNTVDWHMNLLQADCRNCRNR